MFQTIVLDITVNLKRRQEKLKGSLTDASNVRKRETWWKSPIRWNLFKTVHANHRPHGLGRLQLSSSRRRTDNHLDGHFSWVCWMDYLGSSPSLSWWSFCVLWRMDFVLVVILSWIFFFRDFKVSPFFVSLIHFRNDYVILYWTIIGKLKTEHFGVLTSKLSKQKYLLT